jgi:hypothetical protein
MVRAILAVLMLVVLGLATSRPAAANGVPIRVPLSYLAGLSNWGPPEARGEAEMSFSEALIRVDVRGLPALRNEAYQLWLGKSGTNKAVPVGVFTAGADGIGGYTGKIEGLDGYDYDVLVITVEPAPDPDPAPTTRRSIGGFFTPIKKQDTQQAVTGDMQPATLPNTGEPAPDPAPRHTLALALFVVGGLSLFVTVQRVRKRA